jgi:hypothetical protein
VAEVPAEEFEQAVEQPKPATVTELAKKGTKPRPALADPDEPGLHPSMRAHRRADHAVCEAAKLVPALLAALKPLAHGPPISHTVRKEGAALQRLHDALKRALNLDCPEGCAVPFASVKTKNTSTKKPAKKNAKSPPKKGARRHA